VQVHLLDGTYEIFRHYFGLPADQRPEEDPVRAARGVVLSVLSLLEEGVTHIGVATDHVIESFRNDLWPGYKSSAGVPRTLLDQFVPLEEALVALGVTVFPMVELEADDALAAAARVAAADPEVERVVIMTPDKDLAQCVVGERVVQLNRRTGSLAGEAGVRAKYGVPPASIPDYLALVGDSADGYPGLRGWGAKGTAAVLDRYPHLEDIPAEPRRWDVDVRGAASLSATLEAQRDLAYLFRDLATLRDEAAVLERVADLRWTGPPDRAALEATAERLRAGRLVERVAALVG
jgi:5'-3' exonuclease